MMMMKRFKLLVLCALPLLLGACATIDMDCAKTGSDTITIGGSNVGNQIVTTGGSVLDKAGLLAAAAKEPLGAAANPSCHVHYTYLTLWGTDYVNTQHVDPAPTTPTPLNVTVTIPPTVSSPPAETR